MGRRTHFEEHAFQRKVYVWLATRCCITASLLWFSFAPAQYVYNPAAADEAPGIRYFGSAKDDKGALLSGVSISLEHEMLSFLFVTDDAGRFRQNVPLDMISDAVTVKCFKAGFQLIRINKRPGPNGPKQTVQVDCVLRAATTE